MTTSALDIGHIAARTETLLAEGHSVETLAAHIAELESERYELITELEQTRAERDQLIESAQSFDPKGMGNRITDLEEYSARVTAEDWYRAEVVEASPVPFGTRVVLDVDMSAGEAIYATPGTVFTLSHAAAQDFAQLAEL